MKLFLVSLTLLASLTSQAMPGTFQPNYYKCKGDGVEFTFGKLMVPSVKHLVDVLDISKGLEKRFTAIDTQITMVNTHMGKLVSAVVETIPDLEMRTVSIVIPKINLRDPVYSVDFQTQFVVTRTASHVGGPSFIVGLVDHSESKTVSCTATAVL